MNGKVVKYTLARYARTFQKRGHFFSIFSHCESMTERLPKFVAVNDNLFLKTKARVQLIPSFFGHEPWWWWRAGCKSASCCDVEPRLKQKATQWSWNDDGNSGWEPGRNAFRHLFWARQGGTGLKFNFQQFTAYSSFSGRSNIELYTFSVHWTKQAALPNQTLAW